MNFLPLTDLNKKIPEDVLISLQAFRLNCCVLRLEEKSNFSRLLAKELSPLTIRASGHSLKEEDLKGASMAVVIRAPEQNIIASLTLGFFWGQGCNQNRLSAQVFEPGTAVAPSFRNLKIEKLLFDCTEMAIRGLLVDETEDELLEMFEEADGELFLICFLAKSCPYRDRFRSSLKMTESKLNWGQDRKKVVAYQRAITSDDIRDLVKPSLVRVTDPDE
jgi:hypothetical protein